MRTAYKGTNRLWMLLIAMLLVCGMAFGAIAEEGAAQTGTNDLDGSKIEGVKVIWVTQDSATTAEGDPTPEAELKATDHLYLSSVSNSEMEMVYRIEAEFSGQYDYAPGDITITIPAQVWYGRKYEETGVEGETVGVVDENRLLGYLELPVPAAPSKKADFNWQIIDGNYVLTNTRTIGATSSVSIEVGIRGIRPVDVVDMSETAPITAHVEVVTNQGNTIELTSTPITAQLDTQARITGVYKNGEVFEDYPGLSDKLLANLPADANPNDYIYVRWYTYHSHNNNQPYSLDIADVLSDAYEKDVGEDGQIEEKYVTDGIFLGSTNYEGQVLTGEIDFTAEIGDHFTNTTTGTQYANTVYMWSAYKKSDFDVPSANEPQRVYYFKNEVTWTLTETDKTVEDSGNGKGEDPQKITTKTDEVILPYAPVKWQRPRGAFAVNKWTERVGYKDWLYGYALNLLESREEVDMDFIVETVGYGYPWTSKLTKDYSYGELNNTVVNGDLEKLELDASAFGKLGWKQVTDDFQTFFNFETEPLTSKDFEFKSLRVSVPGKMRYAKKSNGTWDYVSDSTLPTPDLMIEYQLNNEDTWYPAATATWGEDGLGEFKFVNVADGVTTSGMTVFFPENVTDTRHTFVSNVFDGKMAEQCDIAMLDWYVYPTITMKSSDRVYGIVQELFEQSENPSTKFRNDVIMDAYGWVGSDDEAKVLDDDYDYSMATYEGASYGVALTKSGTSESDAENQRLVIHYTATLTEQSNLKERSDYDEAVEAGVIPAETSGIWYDLLPPHVVPLLDTIKLRKGDTITNVYTQENYNGTGRTLLVVEAELTPVPASYNSIGYADRPTLEFDAAYTWMDMDEYGSELVNYVAFESTVEDLRNDTLGTIKNQKGDPDTPAGGNNANTPSMPEDIIKALTDLDPNTDENRFVYGKCSHTVSSLTYAVSGLQKAVKNDLVGIWTQGLDGQEQVTVYEGHYYTYSLRVSSAENTATKGIVIYDTIENYIIPDPAADEDTDATKAADFAHTKERKDWSGVWQGKGQWRGTLTQVDLSEFVKAKVKPVLLYSTIPNLQFADSKSESTDGNFDEDTELFSSGSYDITDREIWQVAELDENGIWHVPGVVAVTAVAIDATTTADGKEFVLKPEEALAGYLKMRAPDDDGDEDVWNAKGAYARKADNPAEIDWEAAVKAENNMYAYNNARVRLMQGNSKTTTQIDPETGKEVEVENTTWLSNLRMIRNDYTRVGIVPEIVTVEKTWQDQNDHDAMRPESVTINVLRRLAGTAGEAQPVLDKDGQPLTAVLDESNGWKAEFKQVDIVNEDGVRYLYTFEEEPVEGYTSKVQFIDVNHYTMINVHPNEQVDVSGEKTWSDDNNALGFRPAVVTLKLYRDGEQIDTRTVKPNGAGEWKYTFGKLDKYAEGGKEYEYKVEEEYVPKYVGEANGYEMVNNTYIPVGALEVSKTLVGATDAAKDQEFTFTLVLLAEQTDPTAPAVPLMDKYAYTIYTLEGEEWVEDEIGEIGNSGTFKLKGNQKIVVYDLPSEATYEVVESEAAGFTSTATDADGSIRAGQTVQAAFVNEYKASGSVQLNVGKSLTGHAIRKNQFRFELVDNNPDSPTYGEVIRTARVEAPEEGATTGGGGSGVEIESLTQAIFGQLEYTQADHGQTYNYQVREVDTGKSGYTADDMVFNVAVSVTDNGDGTMTVTPAYTDAAGDAVTELKFKNEYHAEGELTLKAWKTLEGRELKTGEFTFELYEYDEENNGLGELISTATNDAEGNIVFDALKFDQDDVSLDENNPATYTYLIREKQGTDKTVAYSNQEYVMTVTVFDNGDGTLSFAQGSQGYTREYPSCSACGGLGLKRIEFTQHYNSGTGTGGNGFTPYRDSKTQAILQIICKECNGLTRHEDPSKNLDNGYCAACGGSGIQANQTIIAGGKEYVFGNYRKSPVSSQMIVPVEGYDCLGVAVCNYGDRQVLICESCYGARVEPGKMTITGGAAMPVFANELKPGDLTVTKQVQGEGSSNPTQRFNFRVKLTGEKLPDEIEMELKQNTLPEVEPAEVTPWWQSEPDEVKPIYHATATDLVGDAYAVLNETTGEMVFFRAEADNMVDPFGNAFAKKSGWPYNDTGDLVYFYNFETREKFTQLEDPYWVDSYSSKIKNVRMEGAIKPKCVAYFFYLCKNLQSCDLSLLDTSEVTNFSHMFYEALDNMSALDVSNFDFGKATDIEEMFYMETGISSINIGNMALQDGCNQRWVFGEGKIKVKRLTIGDGKTFDTHYSYYPTDNYGYTGNWRNVETGEVKKYIFEGSNAGTWIWDVWEATLTFNAGEGAGTMASVTVPYTNDYTFYPLFYRYGYRLVGMALGSITYPVAEDGSVTIPLTELDHRVSSRTLTAVWEPIDTVFEITEEGFTFALEAGESATFSDLPANTAYEVWEELPTGWVLVEKKDDTGVIKPLETSEAVFTNEYQPEKAQANLRASKLLDGEAPESGKFSFTLSKGDTEIETVTNDGSGVVFAPITYEKEDVGTHTYTIKEDEGTDTTINYDAAGYTVKVEVTDDGKGNLSAKVTYLDADGEELTEPPVFKNTTKPGALFISKAIIGATEKAKEQVFTFEVTFTDELLNVWKNGTVSLKGGESITVADIPAGLKYEVKETGSYPGWTMDGTIKEGKIASNETAEEIFTNAYTLTGVASIEAKKVLVGRDLTAGEFTFQLVGENNNVVAEATNGADGRVLFPQMTYTEEGTWKYVIVEAKPNEDKIDNTVEYSGQQIKVTVTATDEKGDGTLTTTVTYSPEKTPITNTLKPGALEISKTVDSSNPDHAEKVFTFTVTLTDKEGKAVSGTFGNHTFDANGQCKITLKGGEKETISKLPAGTQYSVTEAKEAGFTTEMTGDSGVIMPNETAYAVFTNAYAAEGEYAIEASKTLKGADLATEQFTFELTMPQADGSETVLETVTNDADGKITFSKLIFTDLDEGAYVYRIREVNDRKPGFTYDDTVYEFTLVVKDNSDGTMTITPEGLPEGGIEFKNTYNDKTNISVEKAWADEENKLGVRPVSVTVELYQNGKKLDEVVLNAGNTWKHTFSELPAFDENGVTYTYTVKELPVAGYDGMQSIKDGVNVFTNTVQGVLDVSKTVVAGTDAEKEFAFTVTLTKAGEALTTEVIMEKADMREAVKPDAEGKVRFALKDGETARLIGLPIGTEYKVEEATEAGYTTTMENAEGLIQRYEEHKAEFTNTYAATGEITFEGIKTLSGRDMTDEDVFTFEITDGEDTWTVKNDATGKITYPTIEYIHNATTSDLGEHTYTVKEVQGDLGGVTYATTEYTIKVNVSDNGDGTLKVEPSDNYTKLDFANTYEAAGDITFEGAKTIEGRKMTDKDIFTFEVSDGTKTWTVENDNTGKIAYPKIEYTLDDVGDHTYTVRETSKDGKGITVAKNSYTVTVTVTDNGDGTLNVVASDNATALDFVNTYEATGEITFEGVKSIDGRKLTDKDIFTFEVSDGENTWTVENDKDGKIAYPKIEYTLADVGEHTYTVKETSTNGAGITVDTKTYEVTVTVSDNGDGTLKVVASDNHKALNFTNTYEADGTVRFKGTKQLVGREFRSGDAFLFELVENGVTIQRSRLTTVEGTEAAFEFNPIEYTTADIGTHTYLIHEEKGSIKGVTYDAAEYTVTVTVADAGNGKLSVSKAYAVNGETAEKVLFTNIYEATGELTLTAEKTVNGAQPTADQVFDFTLSDKNGEIETVQNKLGEIEFAKLTYTLDDLGEHSYTVKENKTDKAGYAIDETVYTVKVNVTDNGDGTLKVEKKITANGKPVESMIFDNKHSATLTISKKVEGCTTEEIFPIKVWLFDAKGNELKGEYAYTGDVTGKLTSGTTIELGHDQRITIEKLPVGSRYKVEETRDPRFTTMVNSLMMNTAEGEIVNGGNMAAFVNRLITTMFKVCKEWQGGEGGSIILTLYANGEKLEDQPAYTQEGDTYYYSGLPMYDEDGDEIIYSAKEKYVDGYLTIYKNVEPYAEETKAIYNGGTIINKAITTIKVQKVWSGLAEGAEVPEITLILHCNGEVYDRKTPKPDSDGWYVYSNLPVFVNGERAVYSVTEEPMEGCSTIYTNNGEEGDCAYNGGTITNIVVPKTGDDAPVELWAAAMLLSAAALVLMVRKRNA